MNALAQSDLRDCHPVLSRETLGHGDWPGKFRQALRKLQLRREERRTLALLTERDFHDMGLTRWELENALAKPFWRG